MLDPELATLLDGFPLVTEVTADLLPALRAASASNPDEVLAGHRVSREDLTITDPQGTALALTLLRPTIAAPGDGTAPVPGDGAAPASAPVPGAARAPAPAVGRPCVYWLHGGGMILGDRFSQIDIPLEWVEQLGVVVVTAEYRLAPEVSGATPVTDAFHGLRWIADHAGELGIDADRIIVAGISAGGGLAAGVTLMARDLGGPSIAAQLLICPMLDHRNDTASSLQHAGRPGIWTHETNRFAWNAVLGDTPADDVPTYVSPALADDLSGLPVTYVDAGSEEVFRDEDVAYASRIWAAGGQAELHVWAGGFHGFDAVFPQAALARAARAARTRWIASSCNLA